MVSKLSTTTPEAPEKTRAFILGEMMRLCGTVRPVIVSPTTSGAYSMPFLVYRRGNRPLTPQTYKLPPPSLDTLFSSWAPPMSNRA